LGGDVTGILHKDDVVGTVAVGCFAAGAFDRAGALDGFESGELAKTKPNFAETIVEVTAYTQACIRGVRGVNFEHFFSM
jgi:hypothetical protein